MFYFSRIADLEERVKNLEEIIVLMIETGEQLTVEMKGSEAVVCTTPKKKRGRPRKVK